MLSSDRSVLLIDLVALIKVPSQALLRGATECRVPPLLEHDDIDRHHLNPGSRHLTQDKRGSVQRIGDTVRRLRGEHSDFVARLLDYLHEAGFAAAPRYLGVDDHGRDIFTYVAGRTTNHPSQRTEACYSAMADS